MSLREPSVLSINTPFLSFMILSFNDPATTEIYTLSLHDALPICSSVSVTHRSECTMLSSVFSCTEIRCPRESPCRCSRSDRRDRKSTRLNSSHITISYAVFCLKKKKKKKKIIKYNKIARNSTEHL